MSLTTLFADAVGNWRQRPAPDASSDSGFPDVADAPPDTRRLIRDRRYCMVLSNAGDLHFDEASIGFAWKALSHEMALVPGGEVCLVHDAAFTTHNGFEMVPHREEQIRVEPTYLDRHCVTNADFAKFVQSGAYEDIQYWPEDVLPNVLQFTDSSGCAGPKHWSDGNPPQDKLDHPVVGICWYEANAYATWAGKRLPTTEQWQRAGTWPKGHSGNGTEMRYPWGSAFDPSRANTWASRRCGTVAVHEFVAGSTPNGVRQLIGNVWEWVDAQFYPETEEGVSMLLDEAMAEIRGGAFDTYFHSQATCQFRTGQTLLYRGSNVGFRCCVDGDALNVPAELKTSIEENDE